MEVENRVMPVDMESDTFSEMKKDMTHYINYLLKLMLLYREDEGRLSMSLDIEIIKKLNAEGEWDYIPRFTHKITTSVQRKDGTKGEMGGDMTLEDGDGGNYQLKKMSVQTRMPGT